MVTPGFIPVLVPHRSLVQALVGAPPILGAGSGSSPTDPRCKLLSWYLTASGAGSSAGAPPTPDRWRVVGRCQPDPGPRAGPPEPDAGEEHLPGACTMDRSRSPEPAPWTGASPQEPAPWTGASPQSPHHD